MIDVACLDDMALSRGTFRWRAVGVWMLCDPEPMAPRRTLGLPSRNAGRRLSVSPGEVSSSLITIVSGECLAWFVVSVPGRSCPGCCM